MDELDNIVFDTEIENNGISAQSAYDYYEVILKENTIIEKLDNQYNLLNDGFTYLNCILTLFVIYFFIRKLMGRY